MEKHNSKIHTKEKSQKLRRSEIQFYTYKNRNRIADVALMGCDIMWTCG
jgi:hypothetical protein